MGKGILKYTGRELAEKAAKFGLSHDDVADACGVHWADVEYIFFGGKPPPLRMAVFFSLFSGSSPSSKASVIKAIAEATAARRRAYMDVQWRTVPYCNRYEVSDDGRVRRAAIRPEGRPGLELKPTVSASGHHKITVYRDDGTQWRTTIHQLVAMAFVGAPSESGLLVLHADGDPANNTPGNLRWGTYKDNADDRRIHADQKAKTVENQWKALAENPASLKRANKIKMLERLERMQSA